MTAIMLFTRDLRLHDNPAFAAACREHAEVVPLFIIDRRILTARTASPNRAQFLAEALGDLRAALRGLGSDLAVRSGEVVEEVIRLAWAANADMIYAAADVSGYARRRERALSVAATAQRMGTKFLPGNTVVPPGSLRPTGADHYRVFTPYWRAWQQAPVRPQVRRPSLMSIPHEIQPGELPTADDLVAGPRSPQLPPGGESAAGKVLERASARLLGADDRDKQLDDLAADSTTRLSPYLHFGCISPLAVRVRLADAPELVRQLAWRDFMHQLTAAFPDIAGRDYRPGRREWLRDDAALEAWRRGQTGIPIVDAGMRQLLFEGWMHNRARLITASFLTKTLQLDWRDGAAHFFRWLVDGDVANNAGNWQWIAGTGTDTRPNRVLNPVRQAHRFDPDGAYVRRFVPELASVDGSGVHEPWRLPAATRSTLDYPPPLIEPARPKAKRPPTPRPPAERLEPDA